MCGQGWWSVRLMEARNNFLLKARTGYSFRNPSPGHVGCARMEESWRAMEPSFILLHVATIFSLFLISSRHVMEKTWRFQD